MNPAEGVLVQSSPALWQLSPRRGTGEPSRSTSPELSRVTLENARQSLTDSSMPTAGASASVGTLVHEVLRITHLARIHAVALLVLAIGAVALAAPALSRAHPAGPAAQTHQGREDAPGGAAGESQTPGADRYGDPLPAGAVMRLGTTRFRQPQSIEHIVYSPDGEFVVTDNSQRRLQIWNARDGKKLRQLDAGIETVLDFALAADGKTIAATGFDVEPSRRQNVYCLTFIDVTTGRLIRQGEWNARRNVSRVAYAPDGKTVVTTNDDGTIRLWDVGTAKVVHQGNLERGDPAVIALSPNITSHLLAVATVDAIQLWNIANLQPSRQIAVDGIRLQNSVAFSPDGTTLAAGVMAGGSEVRLLKVRDGSLLAHFKSEKYTTVSQVRFSPDGTILAATAATDRDGSLVLFDVATGKTLDSSSGVRIASSSWPLRPLEFSPDGGTIATTTEQQTLHFWELKTGKDRLATPEAHLGSVGALAFLADGKTLVAGSDDRTVRLWDLATRRPVSVLEHDGRVRSISLSNDGSLLATISDWPDSGKVHVWNLKAGKQLRSWSVTGREARGVFLTRDDSSVIAQLDDGSLRRWDVATGEERPIAQPKLEDGLLGPDQALFSRDGRSVVTLGASVVVDVASGHVRFKIKELPMAGVAASAPDGRSLAIVRQGPGTKIDPADGTAHGSSSNPTNTIIWLDSETGHALREIEIPESTVRCLTFSPDGKIIAAGTTFRSERGIIRMLRLRDKREIQTIETPILSFPGGLAFTPDGKRIAAGLEDTSIVIWDVRPAN
jgi:WD40 repeat protein